MTLEPTRMLRGSTVLRIVWVPGTDLLRGYAIAAHHARRKIPPRCGIGSLHILRDTAAKALIPPTVPPVCMGHPKS